MSENKFNIICQVKDCKIKSKIKGFIETNYPEMAQGQDDFKIKVHIDFEEADIPSQVNLSCTSPDGFEIKAINDVKPSGTSLKLEMPVFYTHAPVGYYTVEGQIRHEEFGTELAKLDAGYFHLKVPELKFTKCSVEPDVVKRGDKFDVSIIITSSAPQKIKGTIFGKLKPTEDINAARIYDLDLQKIAVKGERLIKWTMMVPRDEENISAYSAEFKFESKETGAEARFEDVLQLKRIRDIRVLHLKSDIPVISELDTANISSGIKNIGIENANVELKLKIKFPDGNSETLPVKNVELSRESEQDVQWSWQAPKDAVYGLYQFDLNWLFPDTGEKGTVPGDTIEVKARHKIDLKSISTDKDYYLSGQSVVVNLFFNDDGTRAGKKPMVIKYCMLSSKGKKFHEGQIEKEITTEGSEVKIEWKLPKDMSSGTLNFNVSVILDNDELFVRNNTKLINVEQPISLHFESVKHSGLTKLKRYERYILDGEQVESEVDYYQLKLIQLSSKTKVTLYNNKVVGGTSWAKMARDEKKGAEDLLFSHIMLNKAINLDNIQEMRNQWNEQGSIWTTKLIKIGKRLSFTSDNDRIFAKQSKDTPVLKDLIRKYKALNRMKSYLSGQSMNFDDWLNVIQPLIVPVQFVDYKNMKEILQYTYDEKYGKSNLDLIISYLEFGIINDTGKLASVLNDFIRTLNTAVSLLPAKPKDSISKALERWSSYLKNPRIEIEANDELASVLNVLYSVVILKLISKLVNTLDSIIKENKISKKQYVKLCFELVSYHMLNIEYNHFNIKYNRFMDEKLSKNNLAKHFESIEQIGENIEVIINQVMGLLHNHFENMKFRSKAALLYNSIKLEGESDIINGLMGEQIRQHLKFENKSNELLEFNLLFAFPSSDWHLLEPETNLIDGVYWHENLTISRLGKHSIDITVAFPKTLSYKEYRCLIKFEPVVYRLLGET
jgi:hypothetical protein